mmetsp:Transcript_22410/g.69378  ORF Transcript_22410/g.69378 Transcript_22410/m.69378 type:complete len:265 (+) Transcript_22410:1963-2757(+)
MRRQFRLRNLSSWRAAAAWNCCCAATSASALAASSCGPAARRSESASVRGGGALLTSTRASMSFSSSSMTRASTSLTPVARNAAMRSSRPRRVSSACVCLESCSRYDSTTPASCSSGSTRPWVSMSSDSVTDCDSSAAWTTSGDLSSAPTRSAARVAALFAAPAAAPAAWQRPHSSAASCESASNSCAYDRPTASLSCALFALQRRIGSGSLLLPGDASSSISSSAAATLMSRRDAPRPPAGVTAARDVSSILIRSCAARTSLG